MIDPSELTFSTTRSRGPGGQHVNRTETAVILRWNVWETESFEITKKLRLIEKLGPRLSADGDLVIRSDEYRSQQDNRRACLEKLEKLIQQALHMPKPRKATKPTRAAKQKRRSQKERRSEIKKLRQKRDLN